MTKIYCNEFDGGVAESNYDTRANVASDMYHLSATIDPKVLRNFRANQKDTLSGGSTAVYCFDGAPRSTGTFIGLGHDNGSPAQAKFFRKNNNDMNSYWQISSSNASPSTAYTPYYNGCFAYKTYVFGVCYTSSGATVSLYRYEGDANTTSFSTISPTTASTTMANPIVHSQDNIAYFGIGTTISKFDGTTFTGNVLALPYTILSITEYGSYLAILCLTDNNKAVVYLWGRDTSITTLQELFLAGDDRPVTMVNINGVLVVATHSNSASSPYLEDRLTCRGLYGGRFVVLKSIPVRSGFGFSKKWVVWKDVGYILNQQDTYLYSFGWNKKGEFYIAKDRAGIYDGESNSFCYNFFNIGDYFCFANSDGKVMTTYNSNPLYSVIDGYWHSIPNPCMAQQAPRDLPKMKQIKSVWARFYANSAGYGTATMKLTADADSQVTIFSESAPASKNLFVIEASARSDGSPIGSGRDLKFQLITDQGIDIIDYGYEYEVEETQI